MNDKQLVMNLVNRLPENVGLREIYIKVKFLAAIREGEEEADRGKLIAHGQIKKEFASWLSK